MIEQEYPENLDEECNMESHPDRYAFLDPAARANLWHRVAGVSALGGYVCLQRLGMPLPIR